ncbi:pseudouridine synthase [Chitinophaga sp. SYP-B3965]|uniref:pseudouridine synthase n=1 Tax=Chitinophaga sp. SYP-B3965 TaxID=2663120 RepID=UPI001299B090|nr:pseudouridine synthase [Chitinophaga sp. SYP-B3965]MRG48724.1 pseudouridine synthase [Chitinophaga sp. SYP-B3965]
MKKSRPAKKGFTPFKENSRSKPSSSSDRGGRDEKGSFKSFRENGARKSDDDRPKRTFSKDGDAPKRSFGGPDKGRFRKDSSSSTDRFGNDKPKGRFSKDDDKPKRSFGDKPRFGDDKPKRSFGDKPRFGAGDDRPKRSFSKDGEDRPKRSFGDDKPKGRFGDKPRFGAGDDKPKRSFGDKPTGRFSKDDDRPKRSFSKDGEDRPKRSFGDDKPKGRFGDKPRFGAGDDKPKRSFSRDGEDRPKRSFGDDKPKGRFSKDSDGPKKSFSREEGADRPKRSFGDGEGSPKRESRKAAPEMDEKEAKAKSTRKRVAIESNAEGEESSNEMPLNKYISHCGICSRRKAVDFIKDGHVTVNGEKIEEPAFKVTPKDVVTLKDKRIFIQKNLVYVLLNKPKGYITTTDDPEGRQTVMELVTEAAEERLFPVGRLDRNTSGLLLLTNDGELAQKLAHPKHNIKKIYHVELDKPLTKADFDQIIAGVTLEDGLALVDALAFVDTKDKKQIGIEIHSGKNRIVRRIFEHLGYQVEKLDRVMYAGLTKKNVNRGKWRFLSEKEVILLKHFK